MQRVIEDEDLRQNIVQAYESSRDAFGRLSNGKSPTKQIFDDKKLQKDLKKAAESFRDASVALREAPKKQRRRRLRPAAAARHRRRRRRARRLRGPAQEGAGRAVRRRGGVRVHLDDDLRAVAAGDGRKHARPKRTHGDNTEVCERRPSGAFLIFLQDDAHIGSVGP